MRRILFAFLMFVAASAFALPHAVDFSWTLPELDNLPVCGTTFTANCVAGTNLYLVGATSNTLLNASPIALAPGTTGTAVLTFTLTPWTWVGSNTVTAVMVYRDASGTLKESVQATPVTFQSKIFGPGNFTATPK